MLALRRKYLVKVRVSPLFVPFAKLGLSQVARPKRGLADRLGLLVGIAGEGRTRGFTTSQTLLAVQRH